MALVEVQILCEMNVKPSTPTPKHLRRYDLSFLDQIAAPVFAPFIVFFSKDVVGNERRRECMRQSLSDTLTFFFPMAGRIKDNMYIDCNDEGAHYVEAQVNCDLTYILENPVPKLMNNFIPFELDDSKVNELPLVVQVNFFKCGGMALGLCISHKVGDAVSEITLLNSWAAIARRDPNVMTPFFGSATLFPPVDMSEYPLYTGIVKENIATRIFVFDPNTIEFLRERYSNPTLPEGHSSRTETLSAFLWSRYMACTQVTEDGACDNTKFFTLLHAVDLRPRMDPPLSNLHFGNISRVAVAKMSPYSWSHEGYKIVNRVRDAIRQVNMEDGKNLPLGQEHLGFLEERSKKAKSGDLVTLNFTSLCRIPIYEADFGWGKPAWVASANLKFKNLIIFHDAKSGGGMEAWVNLTEEDMVKFEKDEELLAYASPNVKVKSSMFKLTSKY